MQQVNDARNDCDFVIGNQQELVERVDQTAANVLAGRFTQIIQRGSQELFSRISSAIMIKVSSIFFSFFFLVFFWG